MTTQINNKQQLQQFDQEMQYFVQQLTQHHLQQITQQVMQHNIQYVEQQFQQQQIHQNLLPFMKKIMQQNIKQLKQQVMQQAGPALPDKYGIINLKARSAEVPIILCISD